MVLPIETIASKRASVEPKPFLMVVVPLYSSINSNGGPKEQPKPSPADHRARTAQRSLSFFH
jgi:hypothetical protein